MPEEAADRPITCFACDCLISPYEVYSLDTGEVLCGRCYDRDTDYCEHCDTRYLLSRASHDNCGDGWDEDSNFEFGGTTARREESPSEDWPWNLRVGYEVEFFTSESPQELRLLGALHDDGSIAPDFGSAVEFASPPLRGAAVPKNVREVCRILNGIDAGTNRSCGLHVHVEVSSYSDEQRFRIRHWWRKFERALFLLTRAERYGGSYCRPAETVSLQQWAGERYHALNLQAYREHGTYEFRLFASTTDADQLLSRVAACVAFVAWAVDVPHTEKLSAKTAGDRLRFLGTLLGADKTGLPKAIEAAISRNPVRRQDESEEEDYLDTPEWGPLVCFGSHSDPDNRWWWHVYAQRFRLDPMTLRHEEELYWLSTPVRPYMDEAEICRHNRKMRTTPLEELLETGWLQVIKPEDESANTRLGRWYAEHIAELSPTPADPL